jgi:hypothetical protein
MFQELCQTENHITVVYDPETSHAATHFKDEPGLRELVIEVLEQTVTTDEYMWFETDMGRVVGMTSLVETDDSDDIIYAKRLNRDSYTRFTRSRQPQPCSIVTVAMTPLNDDFYELDSAWIGTVGHSFPDTPGAADESREYWSRHALVWGSQAVQAGSETKVCPW